VESKAIAAPLRVSPDRVALYGTFFAALVSIRFILDPAYFRVVAYRGDIGNFWSVGATVGSPALANVALHIAWQNAHGLGRNPFLYLPGFAWLYAPLAHLPIMTALVVEELSMAAICAWAAWLLARLYRFPLWFAFACVFAWGPTVSMIELGQNAGLALALALTAIVALVRGRDLLAGVAIGLLLYKPTEAVPLILLLLMRRQWRAVGVVGICATGWYLLSVPATHGDWRWFVTYAHTIRDFYSYVVSAQSDRAFTLPTLLVAMGAPTVAALFASLAMLLLALPLFARGSALEAGSMATMVGLAASTYAWPYEACILLPGVCFAMVRLTEPWRSRIVVAAYFIASIGMIVPYGAHSLAIIGVGGVAWWMLDGYLGPNAPARFWIARARS